MPPYPSPSTLSVSYNGLNQLTGPSRRTLTKDADGNLLGQRAFTWDAESWLVGTNCPGEPGEATSLAYEVRAAARRSRVRRRPAARSPQRPNYGALPGPRRERHHHPASIYLALQRYYCSIDQIGSVRRVFANQISAPADDYDAYGHALGSTARGNESFSGKAGDDPGSDNLARCHRASALLQISHIYCTTGL